jgi:hypothetical protein
MDIQDFINDMWPDKVTSGQMHSVLEACKGHDTVRVLKVIDTVAGNHDYNTFPLGKIRKALKNLPRPVSPVTAVYALAPSGHNLTKRYETGNYSEAERLMRTTIENVIPLYGWDEDPVDFTLYGDFDQFHLARYKIAEEQQNLHLDAEKKGKAGSSANAIASTGAGTGATSLQSTGVPPNASNGQGMTTPASSSGYKERIEQATKDFFKGKSHEDKRITKQITRAGNGHGGRLGSVECWRLRNEELRRAEQG